MFKTIQNDTDKNEQYLYIADRYIEPALRGNKLGDQLLKIADIIARENNCKTIFATLIPEDENDKELLKKGHEKNGYVIAEDGITAIKNI